MPQDERYSAKRYGKSLRYSFFDRNMNKRIFNVLIAGALLASTAVTTFADDGSGNSVINIEPLFEYPMAPEDLPTLEEKSGWLMEHFWDALEEKKKGTVDQTALNDAFNVYISAMPYASRDKVMASTNALLKRIEKNPALLLQMVKAAEDNLYDPQRSKMLIDEVYVRYLETLAKNKKIDKIRKARYADQLRRLKATMPGATAPGFKFMDVEGNEKEYFPMSTFTIIEFGDPSCDECRMSKLKFDVNLQLSTLIDQGKVNMLFIIPDDPEGWQKDLQG